jgi:hypothetical protein
MIVVSRVYPLLSLRRSYDRHHDHRSGAGYAVVCLDRHSSNSIQNVEQANIPEDHAMGLSLILAKEMSEILSISWV